MNEPNARVVKIEDELGIDYLIKYRDKWFWAPEPNVEYDDLYEDMRELLTWDQAYVMIASTGQVKIIE